MLLNTKEGREAQCHSSRIRRTIRPKNMMYAFERRTRIVSGNAIDAMPALLPGCLPYNEDGEDFVNRANNQTIHHDFFEDGYDTASFASRAPKIMFHGSYEELAPMSTGAMYGRSAW